jgi:uncharacterized membrane protein
MPDVDTTLNILFGLIILITAAVVAYEFIVYVEFAKRSNQNRGKLLWVLVLTSLLLVVEVVFGVWHFFLR